MLTAQVEIFSEGVEELKAALLNAHYNELSEHKKHGYPLNPNFPEYIRAEAEGKVLYITLRRTGKLVGYFVGFITSCLHYQVPTLTGDVIYIYPDERGRHGGVILLKLILKEFKRRELKVARIGTKINYEIENGAQLERLLKLFNFEPTETMFTLWA